MSSTPSPAPDKAAVAVMGAGAVGSFFGAMLARAGHPVTLVGRAAHTAAIGRDGLLLEREGRIESIRLRASKSPASVADASIVLFCVKSYDTETAAAAIAPHLAANALVLSLQNGVDNAERIARHVAGPVVPAIVYVATALARPGHVVHHGLGNLVIGALDGLDRGAPLDRLAATLTAGGVPTRVSPDVARELWTKLVINCAYNPISALGRSTYGAMLAQAPVRSVFLDVIDEVVSVGRASGVALDRDTCREATLRLVDSMPAQRSSTAQDLARGRATEIDALNGFVVRRGAALGIPTPVNRALHALVKLAESQREEKS